MSGMKSGVTLDGRPSVRALSTEAVTIDAFCMGNVWKAHNEQSLAQLIALIAMGQAMQASYIIQELTAIAPAFTHNDLISEAKIKLTVGEKIKGVRTGYPVEQRDGFMFEAISWIAARQVYGKNALLLAPHVSATSQGLDGLMIEVSDDKGSVKATTIFEDKCTEKPRKTFRENVMPGFLDRHENKRSAELVDAASTLLRTAGLAESESAVMAAAVIDRRRRIYRAAFALPDKFDSDERRRKLFKGFGKLPDLDKGQRVAASYIVRGELRAYFEDLASVARDYLDSLEEDE